MGCGVGSVVFKYLQKAKENKNYSHRILLLGYADERVHEASREISFSFEDKMANRHDDILKEVAKSDVVLIHWWNHPLLSDFLVRRELPPARVLLWSHISGATAPNNFTEKILRYGDISVFTTPLSYRVKEVIDLPEDHKKYIRDIWSTGGVEHLRGIKPIKHSGFNIGYIGNVDYAKMHPDFLSMSNMVKIPDAHFIVVGGPNGEHIAREAYSRKIGHKFTFTGFVSEQEKWNKLSTFDVFGYPLSPHHYGTCDQVLQEAMAAGVVPVVLGNPMESYIVGDGMTGIVAKTKKEYAKAIEELYRNEKLRVALAKNAQAHAFERFSLERMAAEWEALYEEVLIKEKSKRSWLLNKKNITPCDVFLESLGDHAKPFRMHRESKTKKEKDIAEKMIKKLAEQSNWQSETKSTVHNFNTFLPGDKFLSTWSNLMR